MNMTEKTRSYLAWLAVLVALVAWSGTAYFAWVIGGAEEARAAAAASAQENSLRQAASMRARSLVVDTVFERAALEAYFQKDVIAIADLITSAGRAAGVSLQLGSALPEAKTQSDAATVNAVGFVIQAQGSYAALMRAIGFLEQIPVPASLERVDIVRTSSEEGTWRASIYLRALTITPISS